MVESKAWFGSFCEFFGGRLVIGSARVKSAEMVFRFSPASVGLAPLGATVTSIGQTTKE